MQECSHLMDAVTMAPMRVLWAWLGCKVDSFSNECLCEHLTDSPVAGISLLKLI